MPNENFVALCSRLYRDNKDAIEMILEYGKPKLTISSIQEFHSRTNTESIHAGKSTVTQFYAFLPKIWGGIVPETSLTPRKYLIAFGLDFSTYENHKIILNLYISDFADKEERSQFVKLIEEAAAANPDSKVSIKGKTIKSTELFVKTISLTDEISGEFYLDDYDLVVDKLVEAYNSPDTQKALQVVDDVVQKFWGGKDTEEKGGESDV